MSSEKRQTRRDFLKRSATAVGSSLLAGPLVASAAAGEEQSRPNVLYLLTDQWRGQALGCAGDPNAETPHIDKMATEGIRLTHCYSNQPLCSPHRSMLMSGRFPTRTGMYKNSILMPPGEYCIAEHFGNAGYATGYIGKWHLDGEGGGWNVEKPGEVKHTQGWQYFSGFNRGHRYLNRDGVYWENGEKHEIPKDVYQPDHQSERAMDWITKQTEANKPWFMMLSWGPPHTPYREIPQKYLDMFDPDKLKLRENVEFRKWDEKKLRENLQGYYAQCKALDDNTGRLLKFLEDKGIAENTIVILTSDHGDLLCSQGRLYKGEPWEESINVPFIAKWPGRIPAGRTSDKLLSSIDLYPTLCGLCGVSVPSGKDGQDYSHVLLDKPGPESDRVYLTHGEDKWRGVRTRRYTYAWLADSGRCYVLYDNEKDPCQMNNLRAEPSAQKLKKKMHAMMVELLKEADDPLAEKAANTEV